VRVSPSYDEPSQPRIAALYVEPTQVQIEAALRNTQGRVLIAAGQLGIDRRKLYQLCERFGIAIDAYRTDLPPKDE
jgi:transcriptional regulator of acetoin/glycerol metabolism